MTAGVLLLLVLTAGAALTAAVVYDDDGGGGGGDIVRTAWREGSVLLVYVDGPNASCPWLSRLVDESQRIRFEMCTRAMPVGYEGVSSEHKSEPSNSTINSTLENTSANGRGIPNGYTASDSGGGVYKVHEEKMTWHEAKATCEAEGAHLVILDSKEEAAAIRILLESQRSSWRERPFTLHAGFSMGLRTPNGWPLSSLVYERWAPKQPAAPICGRIDHDAWLLFGPCNEAERFVCEYEPKRNKPTTRSDTHYFPEKTRWTELIQILKQGYRKAEPLEGLWFKRLDMTTDVFRGNPWEDARRACERDGARLAVLESEEEAETVVNFFQSLPDNEPSGDTLLALRTSEPIDIFGNPVSASRYHLWVEKIFPESCVCIDIKAMLRTCSCENVSLSFLCKYPQRHF